MGKRKANVKVDKDNKTNNKTVTLGKTGLLLDKCVFF